MGRGSSGVLAASSACSCVQVYYTAGLLSLSLSLLDFASPTQRSISLHPLAPKVQEGKGSARLLTSSSAQCRSTLSGLLSPLDAAAGACAAQPRSQHPLLDFAARTPRAAPCSHEREISSEKPVRLPTSLSSKNGSCALGAMSSCKQTGEEGKAGECKLGRQGEQTGEEGRGMHIGEVGYSKTGSQSQVTKW